MVKPYARLLIDAVEGRRTVDVASEWGVPRWVIDDGLQGKVTAPSAKYMPAVARGLGLSVEQFLQRISPQAVT